MTVLHGARVVTPAGLLEQGWVQLDGARIAAVGSGEPPGADAAQDLQNAWLLPGFVDVHMHGGGGHDAGRSPGELRAAVAFHASHGTTRTLVSLVTAPLDTLLEQLGWIADAVADGTRGVIGAHLEGPFLSHARCGAQNPDHLLAPDVATFDKLASAARGTLRSITIAPELPGALALIRRARDEGVIAAIGHSDATYDESIAALDAGATIATHVFNGMRPLHQREPGIAGAALASGIPCEIINDGLHVHHALVGLVGRAPEQLVLVTDAIDAAGMGDGEFVLGGQQVVVSGGRALLAGTRQLSGSTLTMDDAVRRAVLDCGLPVTTVARAAATNPAGVLGIADRCGAIAAGLAADLVVLDEDLRLQRVMAGGEWLSD